MQIYLLYGDHSYARKRAKDEIVQKYRESSGGNIACFTVSFGDPGSQSAVYSRIKQKLTAESLFGQEELLIIYFRNGDSAAISRGKKKTFLPSDEKIIVSYLSRIPSNIKLIIEIPVVLPDRSLLYQTVKNLNGDIQIFKLPAAKDKSTVNSAIQDFLKKEKINIDGYLIQKLVEAGKGDWWYIFTALEQAALLARSKNILGSNTLGNKDFISLWDIPEERSIFKLFDAIGRGDQKAAFSLLYENSLKSKIKSGGEMEITLGFVSLMARQVRQMIALKSGMTAQEAQKNWQVPVFAFSKLKQQADCFGKEFLLLAYEKLVELQEKAKRGLYSPLMLVDFFVFYLVSHRKQNFL